jgi:hypothetical protein
MSAEESRPTGWGGCSPMNRKGNGPIPDYHAPADGYAAALWYAQRGMPVLPLQPRTKIPATTHGLHDATLDTGRIQRYWRRHPHANIGIVPPAGTIVLDVDPRNGGDRELARMIRYRGELPETWCARTGSGGWHHWYAVPDSLGATRGQLAQGVDIKTAGKGYLVAPPSVHPNGQRYQWITPPTTGTPTAAPLWLRLAIKPPLRHHHRSAGDPSAGNGRYSLRCLIARIHAAPEGQRNRTVYGALRDALRQGDFDEFETSLVEAALAAGLGQREVDAIVRSAQRGAA